MRQYLFAPDQWQKHEDDGDLGGYLTDLAMQRSGLNGTLDPIIQMFTNMRYDANMSSLLEGASINWLAKNAQDVISPFVMANDSPNTNTRYFNAARGAFNLVGVPAAAFGLTKLGAVGGAAGQGGCRDRPAVRHVTRRGGWLCRGGGGRQGHPAAEGNRRGQVT